MAINHQIYDQTHQSTKTVTVALSSALIQQDDDADLDYYIKITPNNVFDLDGNRIIPKVIRDLHNTPKGISGVEGKHNTASGDSAQLESYYSTLSYAVEDFILYLIEGDGGVTHSGIDFSR